MTMFTRALPLELTKRVWDFYFLDGFQVLFTASLAILRILKPRLMFASLEEIMKAIKNSSTFITDEEEFTKQMLWVTLPEWVVDQLQGF